MAALRQAAPGYRRALLIIYLLALVVPTLVLLYLDLQSVRRQREEINNLSLSNLRLSGERLAAELERRASRLAEATLRDPDVFQVLLPADRPITPEVAARIRNRLNRIRERHPITQHFFLVQGDAVRFPLVRVPAPQPFEITPGNGNSSTQRFVALFSEAETREIRLQRPDLAVEGYRRSYELGVPDAWKAQALARLARCMQKSNQPKAAQQAYQTLLARYGNLYDSFYRPYALVAGFELDSTGLLVQLHRDLVRGRWELSAEQVDYFLESFAARERHPQETQETEFLDHLRLAHALEESFRLHGPIRASEVYALALTRGQTNYQTYFTPLSSPGGPKVLVGLAVRLGWVQNELLRQCIADLGMTQNASIAPGLKQLSAVPEGGAARVAFKSAFPFWDLSLALASGPASAVAAHRDILIFSGFTVLVLFVLVLGVLLLIRDVSRDMELNRLRADLVSGVSHELKTPLTLIRLYGETLLHGGDFPEVERQSYYQIITRESERLTHLIERVLDFSRIDRGKKQYPLEVGDLAPAIASAVGVYGLYLKRRGFSIETDLAPCLPPVRFDPEAVFQAVLNLLENAVKYSGESKFIGIRLGSQDDNIILEVADHGVGIPAGEREKIFQQFYRAPGSAGKGGYGLGLFLVKHIMDAHGGSIELESEAGRGSRFRLIFPCIKS